MEPQAVVQIVQQGVTASQLAGVVIALGAVGVLIWIAVILGGRRGQRGQIVDLASVANTAAQQANGAVRICGTDGAGGSYALRINPPAR